MCDWKRWKPNWPLGPFGSGEWRMSSCMRPPLSVLYWSGLRSVSMYIEAPFNVAAIVPERKARLLLVSSQARPPSSNESFQKVCMNFTDSIVSLELRTTLPFSQTSLPPHDQRYG